MSTTTITMKLSPEATGALVFAALDQATGKLDDFYEAALALRDTRADDPKRPRKIADVLSLARMGREDLEAVEALLGAAGAPD